MDGEKHENIGNKRMKLNNIGNIGDRHRKYIGIIGNIGVLRGLWDWKYKITKTEWRYCFSSCFILILYIKDRSQNFFKTGQNASSGNILANQEIFFMIITTIYTRDISLG